MRLLCAALMAAALVGCGPVGYLHTVSVGATRALAQAKAAGAEKLAVYEYWSAEEYLRMARDTASYADYQLSRRYGELAERMAAKASAIAAEKRAGGPTGTGAEETPPDLSPAGSTGSGADETPPDLSPAGKGSGETR